MSTLPELAVRHDAAASRFEAPVSGGTAECVYRLQGRVMNIMHTEVPPQAKGQGVAAALVKVALAHARAEGWTVRPSCSYVRAYMRRHPATQDLLEQP
ncbi:MAG: GNAT family N-acetyltransferase [Rubrivivax sp.]